MNTETCYMTETLHGCDDKALKALISESPNKPFFCSPAATLHNPPLWQQTEIISRTLCINTPCPHFADLARFIFTTNLSFTLDYFYITSHGKLPLNKCLGCLNFSLFAKKRQDTKSYRESLPLLLRRDHDIHDKSHDNCDKDVFGCDRCQATFRLQILAIIP